MSEKIAGLVVVHEATQTLLVVSQGDLHGFDFHEPEEGERMWQLPKGRQNSVHEDLIQTALRVSAEETGLDPQKVHILDPLQESQYETFFGPATFFASTWQSSTTLECWQVADPDDIKWARWLHISKIEAEVLEDQVCVATDLANRALSHKSPGSYSLHSCLQSTRSSN